MKHVPVCVVIVVSLAILPAGAAAATGPSLWSQAGCGSCHTLSAAGSSGTVGPNLDDLRPSFSGSLASSEIQRLADWVASAAGGGSKSAGATGASPKASMPVFAVRKLQHDLHSLGYFNGPFTGFYGPITTKAAKRFQRSHGLHADGIWGPLSQVALLHALRTRH